MTAPPVPTIQEHWESLYAKLLAEGWRVTRSYGVGVTTDEQSITLIFKKDRT